MQGWQRVDVPTSSGIESASSSAQQSPPHMQESNKKANIISSLSNPLTAPVPVTTTTTTTTSSSENAPLFNTHTPVQCVVKLFSPFFGGKKAYKIETDFYRLLPHNPKLNGIVPRLLAKGFLDPEVSDNETEDIPGLLSVRLISFHFNLFPPHPPHPHTPICRYRPLQMITVLQKTILRDDILRGVEVRVRVRVTIRKAVRVPVVE